MLKIRRLFFGVTTSLANVRGVIALAAAAALLTGTAAWAGDTTKTPPASPNFGSGAVFGGSAQRNAVCYAFNSNAPPFPATNIAVTLIIRNQNGATIGAAGVGVLGPGRLLSITRPILNTQAYSCTMIVLAPAAGPLFARGRLDIRTAGPTNIGVLAWADLL